ncbi:MAG TPA: ATP-binding protein [Gammaproteobacteria bacterium]
MPVESAAMLRVPAQAWRLQELRAQVRASAAGRGFDGATVDALVLAVNEACMNVIQHGYRGAEGDIELNILALENGIEFRVRDDAPRIGLDDWRPRPLDELRPGGLGVHFIRAIMDEIAYLPLPGTQGNLLSMKKYRHSDGKQS